MTKLVLCVLRHKREEKLRSVVTSEQQLISFELWHLTYTFIVSFAREGLHAQVSNIM